MKMQISDFSIVLFFCISLAGLLASCEENHAAGDRPPPLFPQPLSHKVLLHNDYEINTLTGKEISPLINANGDTIRTGTTVIPTPKIIHSDSLDAPEEHELVIVDGKEEKNNLIDLAPTREKLLVDIKNITAVPLKGKAKSYFFNNRGDSIRTGVPIKIEPKKVPYSYSQPKPAQRPGLAAVMQHNLQILDMQGGFASSNCHHILEDREGNIWLGTVNEGAIKYNGQTYTKYSIEEGLSGVHVEAIIEDRNGDFWFVGWNTGLCRFDGNFFYHYTEKEGFIADQTATLWEDQVGNIWIGMLGGGMAKYDGAFFTFYTTSEGLLGNFAGEFVEGPRARIWTSVMKDIFVGESHLAQIELKGSEEYIYSYANQMHLAEREIKPLFLDAENRFWFHHKNGFGYIDNLLEPIQEFTFYNCIDLTGFVYTISQDDLGRIWMGTFAGFFEVLTDKIRPVGVGELTNVLSVENAHDGSLWLGNLGSNVARLRSDGFASWEGIKGGQLTQDGHGDMWHVGVDQIAKFQNMENHTPLGGIRLDTRQPPLFWALGLDFDQKGNLWMASYQNGLFKLNRTGQSLSKLQHFSLDQGLRGRHLRMVLVDSKDQIWVGSERSGAMMLRFIGEDQFTITSFDNTSGLSHNAARCIIEDKNNIIWIGTFGGGVCRFDPLANDGTGSFIHLTECEGLPSNNVFAICEDQEGSLWFGTYGGGVTRYLIDSSTGQAVFTHISTAEGLSHNNVWSIVQDITGDIWVATDNGLNRISKSQSNQADYYRVENFGFNAGLREVDFSFCNGLALDSSIYWTSRAGLIEWDLEDNKLNKDAAAVHLISIDINGTKVNFRDSSRIESNKFEINQPYPFYNYPKTLELPNASNHLTFHFESPGVHTHDQIKFSHRIKKVSDKWSLPTSDTKADYRNLPVGKLVFEVCVADNLQQWSKPFTYAFEVLPPWWRSNWAYATYLVLGMLMAFQIDRFQRRRLIAKERAKTQQRELAQAKEIEKAYHQLQATQAQLIHSEKMASLGELTAGIAHEIQNPLNFVNNFSEVSGELISEAREELDKGDISEAKSILDDLNQNLNKINHHGDRASSIVKGMLDHSRTSSGEKVPIDINKLCDEYVRLAYHGMRAKDKSFNVKYETDFQDDIPPISIVPQDIGRVILNLVNNAFQAVSSDLSSEASVKGEALAKEGQAQAQAEAEQYQPLVKIRTELVGGLPGLSRSKAEEETRVGGQRWLVITISDNGPGIPSANQEKIFQPFFTTKPAGQGTGLGLSLSYDIIKAHGGNISVESDTIKGTLFSIQLPTHSNKKP